MKKLDKKSTSFRAMIGATAIFALSLCLLVVSVCAWFVNTFFVSNASFATGELSPQISIQFWDGSLGTTNKWSALSQSDGSFAYTYFGEITDITRLPDDCVVYLKIKIDELSGARYSYNVFLDSVEIRVFDKLLSPIAKSNLPQVDYYNATPSQNCFEYHYFVGADGILAESISYSQSFRLLTQNLSLSQNQFVASEQWLYVRITPRLAELQNILKCIPTVFMPYNLEFWFHISGESRTLA